MQWTPDHLQCALIPLRSLVQTEICPIDVLGDYIQFNRAMSESGVHDKREYPTRWEMTIHYTANDYSLFKAKQSKAYRRKQSSWDCIACHHSLHPEWAKDLRFAQTGFGVYWLWICLLLSAFSIHFLPSVLSRICITRPVLIEKTKVRNHIFIIVKIR